MAVKNRTIQIRLTKEEREIVKTKMGSDGYHNLSVWVRKRLLSNSLLMEQKVDEVYRFILELKREKKMRAGVKNRVGVAS